MIMIFNAMAILYHNPTTSKLINDDKKANGKEIYLFSVSSLPILICQHTGQCFPGSGSMITSVTKEIA
jgi:uncharacterized Fe-S cluster protein YjdI